MIFHLTDSAGQPRYVQLVQQIRHAIESGGLREGDQLPSIRTLAEELVVSPGTVIKAYLCLESDGLVETRPGAGVFICLSRRAKKLSECVQAARERVDQLIIQLREEGLLDDEIRRLFEAQLMSRSRPGVKR